MPRQATALEVKRVRVDRQGYANRGRDYFGVGAPLYRVWNAAGDDLVYVRASNAKEARVIAAKHFARRDG